VPTRCRFNLARLPILLEDRLVVFARDAWPESVTAIVTPAVAWLERSVTPPLT